MSKFESCGLAQSPGSFLAACKKKKKENTIMRDKSTGSPFLYVCKWRDFGYKRATAARPGRAYARHVPQISFPFERRIP